jgi:hypothetical protein
MSEQKEFWFRALALTAFLALALSVYWKGRAALPLADHRWILMERDLVGSDWDFLLRMVSFTRARHIQPGDAYLFRPLTHATLAIIDIFLRNELIIQGLLSIGLHALVGFFLFLVLNRFVSRGLSLALAIFFIVQYSGLQMIYWRQISPYMFSLLFLLVAALAWPDKKTRRPLFNFCGALLCLTASCLFHELTVMALCLAFFFFVAVKRQVNSRWWLLLVPVAVFLVLNAIDYATHPVPFFGRHDKGLSGLPLFFESFFLLAGSHAVAFSLPWLLLLRADMPHGAFVLRVANHADLACGVGIIAIVFLFLTVQRWRQSKGPRDEIALTLALIYTFAVLLGLALGRGTQRGIACFEGTTEYFYFTNAALCLAVAILSKPFLVRKPRFKTTFIGTLLLFTLIDGARVQLALARAPFHLSVARAQREVKEFLDATEGYCLEAANEPAADEYIVEILLRADNCQHRGGTPLHLSIGASRRLELVTRHGDPVFTLRTKSEL